MIRERRPTADDLPGWDEARRPVFDPGVRPTPAEQAQGDHLRIIHQMYRGGLEQVAEVIAEVVDGRADVADARAAVHGVGLRATYERLGSFCGQLCRAVEVHHRIEDAHLYPALRGADPMLGPVLNRLHDEHQVIHELLVRIDDTLLATSEGPDWVARISAEFTRMRSLLESHFGYEEDQLCGPLGIHEILV